MFVQVFQGQGSQMVEFAQMVQEGRQFVMRKYLGCGCYSAPQIVSAERALHKSKVRTADGYCPYDLEVIL